VIVRGQKPREGAESNKEPAHRFYYPAMKGGWVNCGAYPARTWYNMS
jgi:hypothetical protein